MENILKEINLKIKEIVQNEEIDTNRLTELINVRDRLKSYNITSVSQVQVQGLSVPTQPTQGFGMRQHQNNSIYDTITDIANVYIKNQSKQINNKDVNDLMCYHNFISKLEDSSEITINTERVEIKNNIEQLIMKEFKNIIHEKKNKEKDKIIETTIEGDIND